MTFEACPVAKLKSEHQQDVNQAGQLSKDLGPAAHIPSKCGPLGRQQGLSIIAIYKWHSCFNADASLACISLEITTFVGYGWTVLCYAGLCWASGLQLGSQHSPEREQGHSASGILLGCRLAAV